MSSNLSIMSTNLATMASALATMSSNLATTGSSLATTTGTNVTSTAPSTAQPEGFRLAPVKQTVHILTFTAHEWGGPLNTPDGTEYTHHGTLGVYMSQELAKHAGRQWSMEARDNRLMGNMTNEERRAIKEQWQMRDIDQNGMWTCGWREPEVGKRRELCENLVVAVVERELKAATYRADGDDGKGKGTDKGEGQGDKAVEEEA